MPLGRNVIETVQVVQNERLGAVNGFPILYGRFLRRVNVEDGRNRHIITWLGLFVRNRNTRGRWRRCDGRSRRRKCFHSLLRTRTSGTVVIRCTSEDGLHFAVIHKVTSVSRSRTLTLRSARTIVFRSALTIARRLSTSSMSSTIGMEGIDWEGCR